MSQNEILNSLISLQWNSSFSSSLRPPSTLSTLFAYLSKSMSITPQMNEITHNRNPKNNAQPKEVAFAIGGIE